LDHRAQAGPGDCDRSSNDVQHRSEPAKCSLEQELTDLYRANAARLFHYGLLLTRDASLAEEAVQETFLKYYVQRQRTPSKMERPWLFRVMRNYILDQQKSSRNKTSVSLDEASHYFDQSRSPESIIQFSQAIEHLQQVLSPREMECLQLRTEGFSYKEIGAILAIETGTVGALLARSTEKIRKTFGREGF
jgi:RNA polymerase sigma-70 factor, ECF subfamily